jgi:hypothetical protein
MPDHNHKKTFLNLPKYEGGSKTFKEFIASNRNNPKQAMDAGMEGGVVLG